MKVKRLQSKDRKPPVWTPKRAETTKPAQPPIMGVMLNTLSQP